MNRRDMLKTGALAGGVVALGAAKSSAAESQWEKSYAGDVQQPALAPGLPDKDYTPVSTPNISSLPWKIVDGVKVFHLVAEEVSHNFAQGLKTKCWGYNGKVHGPTIEAVEGDHIRIYVTNNSKPPHLFTGTVSFSQTGWTASGD